MAEINITAQNFETEVLASPLPVLVDFWATWCGPCRMLAPTVSRIAEDQAGILRVAKVDVDKEPELAMRYGVASIPTLILFRDGKEAGRTIGFQSMAEIEKLWQ